MESLVSRLTPAATDGFQAEHTALRPRGWTKNLPNRVRPGSWELSTLSPDTCWSGGLSFIRDASID